MSFAIAYFIYVLLLMLFQQFINQYLAIIISQFSFIFVLLMFSYRKLSFLEFRIDFRINKLSNPNNFIYTIIAFVLIEIFIYLIIYLQSAVIPDFLKNFLEKTTNYIYLLEDINYNNLPLVIFALAVIPAAVEELVFRGYLQKVFERIFHYRTAITLTSFIFAIVHFNLFNFLPLFFISLVIGSIAYYTNSVFPGIIIHFLINSTTVVVKLFDKSNQMFIKGAKIDFDFVFYFLLSVVSLIIIIKAFKRQNITKINEIN